MKWLLAVVLLAGCAGVRPVEGPLIRNVEVISVPDASPDFALDLVSCRYNKGELTFIVKAKAAFVGKVYGTFGNVGRDYSDPRNSFGMASSSNIDLEANLAAGEKKELAQKGRSSSAMWANCGAVFLEISDHPLPREMRDPWFMKVDCKLLYKEHAHFRQCESIW